MPLRRPEEHSFFDNVVADMLHYEAENWVVTPTLREEGTISNSNTSLYCDFVICCDWLEYALAHSFSV